MSVKMPLRHSDYHDDRTDDDKKRAQVRAADADESCSALFITELR